MKRRRSNPTEYVAYVDESQKHGLTYAVAVLIPKHKISVLDWQWENLRRELRAHMIHHSYPRAQKKLADPHFLPEIHAVALYGSSGYFHYPECPNQDYWRYHRNILARAVALIQRVNPVILFNSFDEELEDKNEPPLSDSIAREVKYKKLKDKMDRLYKSGYVRSLNNLISLIEDFAITTNSQISIICDDHEDGRGFSAMQTFRIAAEMSDHPAFYAPEFTHSHEDNLLQAADVVTYVISNTHSEWRRLGGMRDRDISHWKYTLNRLIRIAPISNQELIVNRTTARWIELLVTQSGGPKEYQDLLRSRIGDVIRIVLEGRAADYTMELTSEGLYLAASSQEQMYRPPSEDGDLSEDSLPETGNPDQKDTV